MQTELTDHFGRHIDYLRISLTDRCNLRCIYCMPEEGIRQIPHEQVLTYNEIIRICQCMAKLGIRKIKLTGGEPLIRKDCAWLAKNLHDIPGIERITLTTNGILLAQQLPALMDAGVDAINISLDTLDPELFTQITRWGNLSDVLAGLETALSYPQLSVKLNCVPVIKNEENLIALAGLAKKYSVHVRFIEMMPIGRGKQFALQDEESIRIVLEKAYGEFAPATGCFGNGPCRYYSVRGFRGNIGFISAMTHKFCHKCNRLRLTAEGFLKGCLQYQAGTDLRRLLRSGCTDGELMNAIKDVIVNKPAGHSFYTPCTPNEEVRIMSQIGG